jgi:hypothetical protein
MPAAHYFDVHEVWCPASLQATREGRAEEIPLRVDRREPYAAGKAVVGEVTQQRRPRGHLPQAWQHVPDEMSRAGPERAAVRSPQRHEMAHTTGAVQLLNVVPSDQPALRVAHEIDALAAVFANELFDPVGYHVSQFLYRPSVEAAEEPAEVDAMRAVSQPTESTPQPADDARCSEEAVHEQQRSLTAVRR